MGEDAGLKINITVDRRGTIFGGVRLVKGASSRTREVRGAAVWRPLERHLYSIAAACVVLWLGSGVLLAQFALAAAQPGRTALSERDAPQDEIGRARNGITVVILGDSLSLCGFGKRLDAHFRQMPEVKATFTYMACGTNPLSWLKEKPYASIKTHCGFWSIESVAESNKPRELQDSYGMGRRSSPKPHPVPKLEDMFAQFQPDVLVIQTGTNLFDLFPGRKSVRPDREGSALRKYVLPFVLKAVRPPSPLRKIYWVASPTSGRVSQIVQDFVVDQVRADLGKAGTVIDSRTLVSYPYHHMEPDHEHFLGTDMDEWADKVFAMIQQDLSSQPLASLKPLCESAPPPTAAELTAPSESPAERTVSVTARLVFKSKPIPLDQLLPYQESLVGFVYDIKRVLAGQYTAQQILVMHPAHIRLARQPLRKYRVGRTYKLQLRQLEGTPWDTIKRKDDSGLLDLEPYIRLEDESKYPGENRAN